MRANRKFVLKLKTEKFARCLHMLKKSSTFAATNKNIRLWRLNSTKRTIGNHAKEWIKHLQQCPKDE